MFCIFSLCLVKMSLLGYGEKVVFVVVLHFSSFVLTKIELLRFEEKYFWFYTPNTMKLRDYKDLVDLLRWWGGDVQGLSYYLLVSILQILQIFLDNRSSDDFSILELTIDLSIVKNRKKHSKRICFHCHCSFSK